MKRTIRQTHRKRNDLNTDGVRIMRKGTITIEFDLYDSTCEDEMMICTNRLMEVINDSKDCDIGKLVDINYD